MIDHNSIRYYRLKKGLTQKDLAEKLHIATNTLSDYENGKILPNSVMLQKIFEVLGYHISLSQQRETNFKPKESPYYTRKELSKTHSDMKIVYSPLLDYITDEETPIKKGILSSVWEFVTFTHKSNHETFLQNEITSKVGMLYVRLYFGKGTSAVKKAIFENGKLEKLLDEWATLEDINKDMYNYIKYRNETEVLITDIETEYMDETFNEVGKTLFEQEFHETYLYGVSGELM